MRFRECEVGGQLRLVLETPIALTPWQRERTRYWARENYRKRLTDSRGWKKAGYERIMAELDGDTFLERPVPAHDWERECLIFGGQ